MAVPPLVRPLIRPFAEFFRREAAGSIVLLLSAALALLLANTSWGPARYFPAVWDEHLRLSVGRVVLDKTLLHWINDGLMTGFFLIVGLEIKREILDGEDLPWTNLLAAYSCTECGRCTSVCPANITGKLLSPRKIIMDTRDRMEEKFNSPLIFQPNGYQGEERMQVDDEGTLVRGKVTAEELWACTSCNACVEACPVNINPLDSIIDMRRFLVLEESAAPGSLNVMFSNIENNGAPWAFSPSDRFNWADELYVTEKK